MCKDEKRCALYRLRVCVAVCVAGEGEYGGGVGEGVSRSWGGEGGDLDDGAESYEAHGFANTLRTQQQVKKGRRVQKNVHFYPHCETESGSIRQHTSAYVSIRQHATA